jgi:hypothetical protein
MMKLKYMKGIPILLCVVFSSLASCRKTGTREGNIVSLTILNAVSGSNPIVTNFAPIAQKGLIDTFEFYATALQIAYGGATEIPIPSGTTPLRLVQVSDTSLTLWSGSLTFQPNSINTLFIIGDTVHIDTMLIANKPPYYPIQDSNFSIRFVNLSNSPNPVSVNLTGNVPGSEVASLSYKSISSFMNYAANGISQDTYTFEFRDASSGQLVGPNATYTFSDVQAGVGSNTDKNNYRYRSFTVALIGDPSNGGIGLSAVMINNY